MWVGLWDSGQRAEPVCRPQAPAEPSGLHWLPCGCGTGASEQMTAEGLGGIVSSLHGRRVLPVKEECSEVLVVALVSSFTVLLAGSLYDVTAFERANRRNWIETLKLP